MTGTAITPYAAEPLSARIEYAQVLARASLIPKSLWTPNRNDEHGRLIPSEPSVGNVLLVMEHGAMLDLHPMAAINGIFIIEGKASMSANLMSAVVRGKGYTLRVVTEGEWGAAFKAIATLVRPDDPEFTYRVEWTEAKAKRADLLGKDNWKKYPESMAKARAISEVIREGATDALNGIGYTPEELGANVTETGEVVEHGEMAAEAPAPSATPPARKRATKGTQGTKRAAAPAEPAEAPSEPQEPETPAPAEPDANVIDAEVVEDEPEFDLSDPENIDRADEAAVRQFNETHGKATGHYITSDAERARQQAKRDDEAAAAARAKQTADAAEADERATRARIAAEQEAQAERDAAAADPQTGEVPDDEGEAEAARIKAERAKRGAPTKVAPEQATEEVKAEPEPWAPQEGMTLLQQIDAAPSVDVVRTLWERASAEPGAMTTEVRMALVKRKARLSSPVEG